MQSDRTTDYLRTIRDECERTDQLTLIVVVLRSNRADYYSAIKDLTLCELGIPSQVRKKEEETPIVFLISNLTFWSSSGADR